VFTLRALPSLREQVRDSPDDEEGQLADAVVRSVAELCEFQCAALNEAARLLGLTLPAVKTCRRNRARRKLQRVLRMLKLKSIAPRRDASLTSHLTSMLATFLIDGGNSYYVDDIRLAKDLASVGVGIK